MTLWICDCHIILCVWTCVIDSMTLEYATCTSKVTSILNIRTRATSTFVHFARFRYCPRNQSALWKSTRSQNSVLSCKAANHCTFHSGIPFSLYALLGRTFYTSTGTSRTMHLYRAGCSRLPWMFGWAGPGDWSCNCPYLTWQAWSTVLHE